VVEELRRIWSAKENEEKGKSLGLASTSFKRPWVKKDLRGFAQGGERGERVKTRGEKGVRPSLKPGQIDTSGQGSGCINV